MFLKDGVLDIFVNILDLNYVIGVWVFVSCFVVCILGMMGEVFEDSGDWIQVFCLGMFFINEVVIFIGMKDYWNFLMFYEEIIDIILDLFFYNFELVLYMDDDQFGLVVLVFVFLCIQCNFFQ